ncbi:MAG: ferrous iron transport protein A [Ruminococcaceae bacterium]|nr:ferrous iron transport protein A [Oscillospiraceae bacterium]
MARTLAQLALGQSARVTAVSLDGPKRIRLQELGFLPGARITALQESPFGDPVAYGVLDTVIALRRSDARHIEIDAPHAPVQAKKQL